MLWKRACRMSALLRGNYRRKKERKGGRYNSRRINSKVDDTEQRLQVRRWRRLQITIY